MIRVVVAFLVAPLGAYIGAWPSHVWLVLVLSIVGTGVLTAAVPVILFGVGNVAYTAIYFPAQLLHLPIAHFIGILLSFSTVGAACGFVFLVVAFWGNSATGKFEPKKDAP